MKQVRRPHHWARMATLGLAVGLGLLLNGDTGVRGAIDSGIDPLEVLDLQVRNNALIIVDTSGSMSWPLDFNGLALGGDDPSSRMFAAKQAVTAVVSANRTQMNFGLASYNITSSDKRLNGGQNYVGNIRESPVVYVTQDANASFFYEGSFTCPRGGATREGFFCGLSGNNNFTEYDEGTGANASRNVYRSFGNGENGNADDLWGRRYPIGCTLGQPGCKFYLQSNLFRDGVEYVWDVNSTNEDNVLVAQNNFTCPLPPAGLTGLNPDADGNGTADERRPCIRMTARNGATTLGSSTFFYTSGVFNAVAGSGCGGAAQLSVVAACTGDNSQLVLDAMRQEILLGDYTGADFGLGAPVGRNQNATGANDLNGRQPPIAGIRAVQSTPLAKALRDVRNPPNGIPYFPAAPAAVAGQQKNFVLLLTDGDDTCAPGGVNEVAQEAQFLYQNASFQFQAETMFIAFTTQVNLAGANKVAQTGSGGTIDMTTGVVTCPTGVPCRDAFTATSTDELIAALQNALEIAVSSGRFSASPSVVSTIFELGAANGADPLDPNTRYLDRNNFFFLPLFDLPNWNGDLQAWRNDGTAGGAGQPNPFWEAGQTLVNTVSTPMQTASRAGRPANRFTFSELHAGANVDNVGGSAALIRRRIFTSAGGGRFPRTGSQFDSGNASGRNVLALWPPSQTNLTPADNAGSVVTEVDPAVGLPGPLDDQLGIGPGSASVLSFADLQNSLGVCRSSADNDPQNANLPVPAPTPCATSDIDYARKEARQILLAYLAGAVLARGGDTLPLRNGVSGAEFGQLLYRDRGDIMRDSTLAQPAVMTPPLGATPKQHAREWILFRDGHRDASRQGVPGDLNLGFGLRNPDFDDSSPASKLTLKPRMSVVFYGTNTMLHAINAATSEELWGYVPFDLLGNVIRYIRDGQSRGNHIYGVATSLRIADVFVPVPFTEGSFTFDGRWRTVLLFGRGVGGKHLTALDVTAPGPFTRSTLQTNPPWVMWSRGNPDRDLQGNPVRAADSVPYGLMGETWSVPAVGSVDTANVTGPEWRAWVGSGYSDTPTEGTTFYSLDVTTGDVLFSQDVGDGTPGDIANNALVASPAAWNSFQLDPPGSTTRGSDFVSRIFVPDLHGRVWKFDTAANGLFFDATVDQPFTEAVALGKLNAGDFVFVGSGRDTRATQPPQFKIFGIEDLQGDAGVSSLGIQAFTENYPDLFRNRTQPAVAFNADGNGRVFFVGQRFNGVSSSCVTSFDTLLFALGAETGAYIYDFDGGGADPYTIKTGVPPGAVSVQGGRVEVSELGGNPAPDPFTKPSPAPPEPPQIVTHSQSIGSPTCRK